MIARDTSMTVSKGVTTGNLLSILATAISLITILVTITSAYGDLKSADERFAIRIQRLEDRQKQSDTDHDLLIRIDQNLNLLRQQVEAALATPQRRASTPISPNPVP